MTGLTSTNPVTGELGPVHEPTTADAVEAVVRQADDWHGRNPLPSTALRVRALDAIGSGLRSAVDELVEVADWETGLGIPRLRGEMDRTLAQIEMFRRHLTSGDLRHERSNAPAVGNVQRGVEVLRLRVPLGPVAVWAASNFPFAFGVPGGDTVSALAAGCPVIVKAHPSQPSTSVALAEVLSRAMDDAPDLTGAVAVVLGDSAGETLVNDSRIRAGAFTGSVAGGTTLAMKAATRPTPMPFFAEMGSVNPVVVLEGAARARRDEITSGFVASLTLGSGQFCTKPGLFLVPSGAGLIERVEASLPDGRLTALNARIADAYRSRAVRLGASVPAHDASPGFGLVPAVVRSSIAELRGNPLLLAECFGPFAIAAEYEDVDELSDLVAGIPGCLVASLFLEEVDSGIARRLFPLLVSRAGRVAFNSWPTGVAVTEAMQHGGPFPASSDSRFTSVGLHAMDRFTRPVALQDPPPWASVISGAPSALSGAQSAASDQPQVG